MTIRFHKSHRGFHKIGGSLLLRQGSLVCLRLGMVCLRSGMVCLRPGMVCLQRGMVSLGRGMVSLWRGMVSLRPCLALKKPCLALPKPCLVAAERGFLLLWLVFGLFCGSIGMGKRVEGRLKASLPKLKKENVLINSLLGKALIWLIIVNGVFHKRYRRLRNLIQQLCL